MPALSVLLQPDYVIELDSVDRDSVLRGLSQAAVTDGGLDATELEVALREREELSSTGFGGSVAMPHVRLPSTRRFHVVLARTHEGVEFGAIDGRPVRLFMLVVGPEQQRDEYAKLMSRAAKFLKAESEGLLAASDLGGAVTAALTNY
jgi:PTS system nitrogen regulatory IIA component